MIPDNLSVVEVRVVGSLIEKHLSTPDHYPLSLNSLTAACNQSTNRDPVMQLDEAAVGEAVELLRRKNVVRQFQGSGSRVPKYRHLLSEDGELSREELAALCVLMLRGSQTLAEVKSRAARLMPGEQSEGIEGALERLTAIAPVPAVVLLPRRPGQKESRYMHQVGGTVDVDVPDVFTPVQSASSERTSALEAEVAALRNEFDDLRRQFAEFRRLLE